jgi:hypothetical protein
MDADVMKEWQNFFALAVALVAPQIVTKFVTTPELARTGLVSGIGRQSSVSAVVRSFALTSAICC